MKSKCLTSAVITGTNKTGFPITKSLEIKKTPVINVYSDKKDFGYTITNPIGSIEIAQKVGVSAPRIYYSANIENAITFINVGKPVLMKPAPSYLHKNYNLLSITDPLPSIKIMDAATFRFLIIHRSQKNTESVL